MLQCPYGSDGNMSVSGIIAPFDRAHETRLSYLAEVIVCLVESRRPSRLRSKNREWHHVTAERGKSREQKISFVDRS